MPKPNNPRAVIEQWNLQYGYSTKDVLLVHRFRAAGLTTEQVADVLTALNELCSSCWDAERGCQCWNDE